MIGPDQIARVEVSDEGVRLTSAVVALTFFFEPPVRACAKSVVGVYRDWLALAGRERFGWYSTETMKRHRPVTAKTFDMLPAWLEPSAAPRDFIALTLKDGVAYNDTPHWLFAILSDDGAVGGEDDTELAWLHLSMHPAAAEGGFDRLAAIFAGICAALPVVHATGGFAIETSPYLREAAQTAGYAAAMRFRGMDLQTGHLDRMAVGKGAVRTVNWLTFVNGALAAEAGGEAALRAGLTGGASLVPSGDGFILRMGPVPEAGDWNRGARTPAYRAADRALRPLVERAEAQSLSFQIDWDEEGTATPAWYRRFADTSA